MVDRVVAPFAADDMAAVETEELVQFRAGEIDGPLPPSIIAKGKDRRTLPPHRHPSPAAAVTDCSRFPAPRPAARRGDPHGCARPLSPRSQSPTRWRRPAGGETRQGPARGAP